MSKEPDLSTQRRAPRPASDETIDSAEVARATSAPTRRVGRPRREKAEPVIQFSTRMALSYRQALEAVEAETGNTYREIIEEAIRTTYPDHLKQPTSKQR